MYLGKNGVEAQAPSAAGEQPSHAAVGDGDGGAEGEDDDEEDDGLDIQLDEPEAAPEHGGSEVCFHLQMPHFIEKAQSS